ncbi:uncharacterized protein ARMOST_02445 [Armillaria ostoyae]|uniref:Uncharacterized protein n=1 Tax=Armillaria ostoyae TaxID=47428 RepID=A0A284QRQ9_ARMOS|nr:uncharacterized protein ARMOST_02445 [Armillaria ostoyae]
MPPSSRTRTFQGCGPKSALSAERLALLGIIESALCPCRCLRRMIEFHFLPLDFGYSATDSQTPFVPSSAAANGR